MQILSIMEGWHEKQYPGVKRQPKTPSKEGASKEKLSPTESPRPEQEADPEDEENDGEDEDEVDGVGARLPKRKRTNMYASLSPAVIQAATKARAEAYAAAPRRPQLGSTKATTKKRRRFSGGKPDGYVHPAVIAAESAASALGGTVPDEYIGQDGNLFYCRICLGVGEVVCCDGCPYVFHQTCLPVGPSKTSLENDDDPWYCHECMESGRAGKSPSPSKRQRKVKERCSECRHKETKANPCVPCSGRNCDQYFHLVCPSQGGEDELTEDSSRNFFGMRTLWNLFEATQT